MEHNNANAMLENSIDEWNAMESAGVDVDDMLDLLEAWEAYQAALLAVQRDTIEELTGRGRR